jgi:phosphoribosylaminoimidazole-succinocarboxamide synthase
MMSTLIQSDIPGYPVRRGKVRDVYDLGDRLVIVATDRLSAFDWILPTPIPDKGRFLTAISDFWFRRLNTPNHLISLDVADLPGEFQEHSAELTGRIMIVKKTVVFPIECVVRGYISGSAWKSYRETGEICGVALPGGLQESDRLPEPIFTPATKAESGHDINISFHEMSEIIGVEDAEELRKRTLDIYRESSEYALSRGLILADTKFEFGRLPSGEIIIIDEVLTPDSSRYWDAELFEPGRSQASFDKQYVRDWLENSGWDKNSPPPELPAEVIAGTVERYRTAYKRLVSA